MPSSSPHCHSVFPVVGSIANALRRVVATVKRGCAALAVDYANPCGSHGWGKGRRLGASQNVALRSCYTDGAKDCVIRTFFCDAKG